MKINYVNADHVHVLVDLPTSLTIEEMMHLLKGASSHWINENNLLMRKFAWGRGYGVFSVSHSGVGHVAQYIAQQEEHHRTRSFAEEVQKLVERYGLQWHKEDETVENGLSRSGAAGEPRRNEVLMRAPIDEPHALLVEDRLQNGQTGESCRASACNSQADNSACGSSATDPRNHGIGSSVAGWRGLTVTSTSMYSARIPFAGSSM